MVQPDPEAVAAFRRTVLDHYTANGRDFAWRRTADPWAILVSEVMLQQTQTNRVEPLYIAWMARWPDPASLAAASLADVYVMWKGLGYNSRALRLRETARIVADRWGGSVPAAEVDLLGLPGIGRYTARAVLAFAWNQPVVFLETNIRAALIHHFFTGQDGEPVSAPGAPVSDRELEYVAATVLDASNPRTWYQAFMDYGAAVKKDYGNPARHAAAYTRQSRFEGSVRQARGAILRCLSDVQADAAARNSLPETALAALPVGSPLVDAGNSQQPTPGSAGKYDNRAGEDRQLSLYDIAAESGIGYARLNQAATGLVRDGLVRMEGDVLVLED